MPHRTNSAIYLQYLSIHPSAMTLSHSVHQPLGATALIVPGQPPVHVTVRGAETPNSIDNAVLSLLPVQPSIHPSPQCCPFYKPTTRSRRNVAKTARVHLNAACTEYYSDISYFLFFLLSLPFPPSPHLLLLPGSRDRAAEWGFLTSGRGCSSSNSSSRQAGSRQRETVEGR